MSGSDLLAIAVGNTRTRVGAFEGGSLIEPVSIPNQEFDRLVGEIARRAGNSDVSIVLASTSRSVADRIEESLRTNPEIGAGRVRRVGREVPLAVRHTLDDPSTVGQDRLLNAIGAFSRARQACVIVDAGTAITVDFVDGEGTFHGGAIAPGVGMMLRALHEGTDALPLVGFDRRVPDEPAFGKSTASAMLLGVSSAARGLVHLLVERYAMAFGAYPRVLATGGDAPALFEGDEIVEHIVPDLQLIGIQVVWSACAGGDSEPE